MPELHKATAHLSTTKEEKVSLFNKFAGCIIKLLTSFVYQEHYFPVQDSFYDPIPMQIAAAMLPYVNQLASKISGFPQTDESVNDSVNVYPGDSKCRVEQPHALWHEESANGLLELIFVTDYIHQILMKAQERYDQGIIFEQY